MSPASQQAILQFVRTIVVHEVTQASGLWQSAGLSTVPIGGAFVTLRCNGALRGCMGTFAPKPELADTLADVARSACNDPRFQARPLTAPDLNALRIEVSLLSRPWRVVHLDDVIVGEHGIIVRRGRASGCFLPRVALDLGWSREMFLSQCCAIKAKLPASAWREPETEIYAFTATVFVEPDA